MPEPHSFGMLGTNPETGLPLKGFARVVYSVRDILTTPKGARLMREEYGSDLFELIDAPMTKSRILAIYAEVVNAVTKWEPEFVITSVSATSAEPGRVFLNITGTYVPEGTTETIEGIEVS